MTVPGFIQISETSLVNVREIVSVTEHDNFEWDPVKRLPGCHVKVQTSNKIPPSLFIVNDTTLKQFMETMLAALGKET